MLRDLSADLVIPDFLRYGGALLRETARLHDDDLAAQHLSSTAKPILKRAVRGSSLAPEISGAMKIVEKPGAHLRLSAMFETLSYLAHAEKDKADQEYYWEKQWGRRANRKLGKDNKLFRASYFVVVLKDVTIEFFKEPLHQMVADLANTVTDTGDWDAENVQKMSSKIPQKNS